MFDFNMRQLDPYAQVSGEPGDGRYNYDALRMVAARDRFDRARRSARIRQWLGRLLRRPRALLDLNQIQCSVTERHYAGLQTVNISSIRGSEGRCHDFDSDFLPLNPTLTQRWVSVYAAMLAGIPMPAVTLIRVGSIYFVRDGHHRISATRLRGCDVIEAEVIVWNASIEVMPEAAPARQRTVFAWPRLRKSNDPVTFS